MTVAQLALERRTRRRIRGLIIALGLLIVLAVIWGIPHIEASRTETVEALLTDQGWEAVAVSFSGRDATLTGVPPKGVDPEEVADTVRSVWGVRTVQARFDTRQADPTGNGEPDPTLQLGPAEAVISVSRIGPGPADQEFSLSGKVPSRLVADTAIEAAQALVVPARVVNQLEVAPVEDALWLSRLGDIVLALDGVGNVSVTLGGGRAVVTGTVDGDQAAAALEVAITTIVSPELEVEADLEVAATDSPVVEIVTDGSGISISGRVPEDALEEAVAAAEGTFGSAAEVTLEGGGVADAAWLADLWELIPHLDQAVELRIAVDGLLASATGTVAASESGDAVGSTIVAIAEEFDMTPVIEIEFDPGPAAEACPAEELNALVGVGVLFDSNSSELTDDGRQALDQVAVRLLACEGVPVEVGGHTDSLGDADYNQFLSEQRAEAVVDYLVEQGVDPERLTAVGYGESLPVADNDTQEGRALNRRIEFVILGSG